MFYLLWRLGLDIFICRFKARTKWKDCWLLYTFSDLWSVNSSVSSITLLHGFEVILVSHLFLFVCLLLRWAVTEKTLDDCRSRMCERCLMLFLSVELNTLEVCQQHASRWLSLRVNVGELDEHIYLNVYFPQQAGHTKRHTCLCSQKAQPEICELKSRVVKQVWFLSNGRRSNLYFLLVSPDVRFCLLN